MVTLNTLKTNFKFEYLPYHEGGDESLSAVAHIILYFSCSLLKYQENTNVAENAIRRRIETSRTNQADTDSLEKLYTTVGISSTKSLKYTSR